MIIFFLIANFLLFILGNIVWTYDLPVIVVFGLQIPIIQILLSELSFIVLYTTIDKGNIKYGWTFTILAVLVTSQMSLPIYQSLFYSKSVQYFSITISVVAIVVNSMIIRKLISSGFTKLFSSRVSTSIASLVEISLFAFLLDIGIQGALSTIIVRIICVTIVPKLFFHKQ